MKRVALGNIRVWRARVAQRGKVLHGIGRRSVEHHLRMVSVGLRMRGIRAMAQAKGSGDG